jgi:hypothetical protein
MQRAPTHAGEPFNGEVLCGVSVSLWRDWPLSVEETKRKQIRGVRQVATTHHTLIYLARRAFLTQHTNKINKHYKLCSTMMISSTSKVRSNESAPRGCGVRCVRFLQSQARRATHSIAP